MNSIRKYTPGGIDGRRYSAYCGADPFKYGDA
jgi:hypothetical protein